MRDILGLDRSHGISPARSSWAFCAAGHDAAELEAMLAAFDVLLVALTRRFGLTTGPAFFGGAMMFLPHDSLARAACWPGARGRA